MQLKDKVAFVTGGTAGIGEAIVKRFAQEGAHVVIFGTNKERGEKVLEELKPIAETTGQRFTLEIVNIGDFSQVQTTLEKALSNFGKCDILVNNAGITKDNLLMKMTEKDWDEVLQVNLKSLFNTCKFLIRPMLKAQRGKIINISSIVGITGNAGQTNYSASKAGMIGFTKALAQEVASRNICVNCVAPGFIVTRMTDHLNPEIKKAILDQIPMKRFGNPDDIASAVLYLASDSANYMTGQVLTVDGGMVM